MLGHIARLTGAALLILACLFLPFIPGDYDALAMALATMAQLFGFAGLLLVPIGFCWLLYEIKKNASTSGTPQHSRKEYYFALAAAVLSLPVAAMVTLGARVTLGPSAAVIGLLALAAYALWRVVPRLRQLKSAPSRGFNPAPLYLVVLPVITVLALYAFGDRAAEFSRNRAISNCAPLINDIEQYRQDHGQYPVSLWSEWEDYKPSIMGIQRYHYEPNGEAYNVFFEQFSLAFGTREFVMYNKQDEHEMTSHNMDLLRIAPEEIRRGYHAVLDAEQPHWKRFLFD